MSWELNLDNPPGKRLAMTDAGLPTVDEATPADKAILAAVKEIDEYHYFWGSCEPTIAASKVMSALHDIATIARAEGEAAGREVVRELAEALRYELTHHHTQPVDCTPEERDRHIELLRVYFEWDKPSALAERPSAPEEEK